MKRIEFIAPVESMRGNLSGRQSLEYAKNNNPAYEAPNGVQYARNYQPRFIGAKRADGLKYFSVRTKTATNLKASTRLQMAVLGVTAAIKSALQTSGVLASLKADFEQLKEAGRLPEGQNTFNKWFSANIKSMIAYKRAEWRISVPGVGIVTIHNPYDLASGEALVIKQSVWVKFAYFFAFGAAAISKAYVTIDGNLLFCAAAADDNLTFADAKSNIANPSYAANLADVVVSSENVTYQSLPIYTMEGVRVGLDTVLTDGEKLTTAEPIVP